MPRRCLRLGLTQRDDPHPQSTLFTLALKRVNIETATGHLILTRLLHHLDQHFSGCVGFVTSRKKAMRLHAFHPRLSGVNWNHRNAV